MTGGDSGIGRSVAAMFALESADVAIVYLPKEEEDAQATKELVNKAGRQCLLLVRTLACTSASRSTYTAVRPERGGQLQKGGRLDHQGVWQNRHSGVRL